jgi:hypothetical protein
MPYRLNTARASFSCGFNVSPGRTVTSEATRLGGGAGITCALPRRIALGKRGMSLSLAKRSSNFRHLFWPTEPPESRVGGHGNPYSLAT